MPAVTPNSLRAKLSWIALVSLIAIPFIIAATSPLQTSREAVYIAAGLAGVVALALLLIQPLLAAGYLPGLATYKTRKWHKWTGIALTVAVALHVVGLYLTSPPDMLDALLFAAPTVYSIFGVIGMWCLVLAALLVALQSLLPLKNTTWRVIHNVLTVAVVITSVAHALMIEGTMGYLSKIALCVAVLIATTAATFHFRIRKRVTNTRTCDPKA